jgi:hypothetical protein
MMTDLHRESFGTFPLPPPALPCLPTGEDQQAVGGVGEGSVTARLQEVRHKGMIRFGLQRQGLGIVSLPPPPPHKDVMYVMDLKIEGFVFLPDTLGKIQSSNGRMEEKDKILFACRK